MRTFRKPHKLVGTNGIAINQRRLMRDLNAIGRIGIGNRGGVTRLGFSIKELRSRQVLIHLMRQAGLAIHIDGIEWGSCNTTAVIRRCYGEAGGEKGVV
jgi:hypothetical protein